MPLFRLRGRTITLLAASLIAMGSLAFAGPASAVDVPPSDPTWSPLNPTPGSTMHISFTGCNQGESVLVRVWATSAGWYFDQTVTALAPGVTNSVDTLLDSSSIAAGQGFGVGIYCGGAWTDAEGRWARSYGSIGDPATTTTSTTMPGGSTTTTMPGGSTTTSTTMPDGSTTTTVPAGVKANESAPAATPVRGAPTYTG